MGCKQTTTTCCVHRSPKRLIICSLLVCSPESCGIDCSKGLGSSSSAQTVMLIW